MTPTTLPVTPAMIAFQPFGEEIRIVLPESAGAVVHGSVRLFLTDHADAYLATAGEGCWPDITGKPEPVKIYQATGLGGAMLAQLAGLILANGKPTALYVRLPDGSTRRFI